MTTPTALLPPTQATLPHARLDTPESAVQSLPLPYTPPESEARQSSNLGGIRDGNLSEAFRHTGWRQTRSRVFRAMLDTSQPAARLKRFETCGSHAYVLRSPEPPYRYKAAGSACHDRMCLPCAQARSQTIALNVLSHLGSTVCRFVTLTIKHNRDGLQDAIDHLYDSFRRLQRRDWWRKRVTGGVAFLEVPHSETDGDWHPHLHCLVLGRYLPKDQLSSEWKQVTEGSFVVDVKLVKDHDKIARYVTKYASKPLHASAIRDTGLVAELLCAIHNRKLLVTFGSWRRHKLTEPPRDEDWKNVGSLADYIQAAADGDETARNILNRIDAKISDLVISACTPRPPPPPTTPRTCTQSLLQFEGRCRYNAAL